MQYKESDDEEKWKKKKLIGQFTVVPIRGLNRQYIRIDKKSMYPILTNEMGMKLPGQ